jgi:hypothetical protein
LIYQHDLSIALAAELTGIYYPTAKAINKVFQKEQRIVKRSFRYRTKPSDVGLGVTRQSIAVEMLPEELK